MIYTLKDLVKIKYGKNQKNVENPAGQYPIFGTGGLMSYADNFLYDKPSVLIGRKGSISKVRYSDIPFWTVDTLFYTEVNEKIVIPKYLYYKMLNMDMSLYNEGTTIPSLRTETLYRIELDIPDKTIQQKVIKILDSIEEKIRLNEEMNNNFYMLLNNLYEENFINNNQYETKKIKLRDIINIKGGYAYKASLLSDNEDDDILVSMGNVSLNTLFNFNNLKHYTGDVSDKYTVKPGDLFICTRDVTQMRNQLGCPGIIPEIFSGKKIIVASNLYMVESLVDIPNIENYLFLLLNSKSYRDRISSSASGTAVLMIKKEDVLDYEFSFPCDLCEIKKFLDIVNPIFNMIQNNINQNQYLDKLKTTLLPNLVSGSIDLKNIDV